MVERRAELRMEDVGVAAEALVHRLRQFHELDVPLHAPGRRRRAADEQVKRDTDRRLEKDQQQPALGRLGRTAERHDDDHRDAHRPFGGKENVDPEGLVGEKRGHVVFASRIARTRQRMLAFAAGAADARLRFYAGLPLAAHARNGRPDGDSR
jgi:hypothetical protein